MATSGTTGGKNTGTHYRENFLYQYCVSSSMSDELLSKFRTAIEQDSMASELDEIEARSCTSDEYDGVQYNFFGRYVPIRPIIDVVAEQDGIAIEQMGHTNDGEHVCLGVFVAELPEQPHPAFID